MTQCPPVTFGGRQGARTGARFVMTRGVGFVSPTSARHLPRSASSRPTRKGDPSWGRGPSAWDRPFEDVSRSHKGPVTAGPLCVRTYFTRVVIEAALLAEFVSTVVVETVTELVIVPFLASTLTLKLIVLLAPLAIVPRLQLMVPDAPIAGVTQLP